MTNTRANLGAKTSPSDASAEIPHGVVQKLLPKTTNPGLLIMNVACSQQDYSVSATGFFTCSTAKHTECLLAYKTS